jgi:hypothetical protein
MKYVKWLVFISSLFLAVFVLFSVEELGFCRNFLMSSRVGCPIDINDWLENILCLLTVSLLPFSLITLRMKIEVFSKWFNFAVWYVPILALTMIYFPLSVRGGLGAGSGITEGFNALVQILIFSIFVIISIVRIVRTYNNK